MTRKERLVGSLLALRIAMIGFAAGFAVIAIARFEWEE